MKLKGSLVAILVSVLVLSVLLSRWNAVSFAESKMAPALADGWFVFETRFQLRSPRLGQPAWWVRFDHEDEIVDFPPSICVSILGGAVDTVEVSDLLTHYQGAGRDETTPP